MTHLLAIDQGTTGTTALIMTREGRTLGRATVEFPQHFPAPGLVEHDPTEIWASVVQAVREVQQVAQVRGSQLAAVGIANQRETTLLWERSSGRPVHRAIVWQDRRTAEHCKLLDRQGHARRVQDTTGLVLDAYFAGTKLHWLLELPGVRTQANLGKLLFGTIDTYLIWRLNGGDSEALHVTDATNAARTLLMHLDTRSWDDEMLDLLQVPRSVLPVILPSAADFGKTRGFPGLPDGVPIRGVAGDQHAALFGQGCFSAGDVKCTYGTGAFVVINTGTQRVSPPPGILSTIGYSLPSETVYALEGSCFVAGAAVQWLRDGLGILESSSEVERLALSVADSAGVVFVPALTGLGAPHWDPDARGAIYGLTRGTTRAHLARAALEGIAHQVHDLLGAMAGALPTPIRALRVDGGAAANDLMMQFQADISEIAVERPPDLESTARGAAMLAGLGCGLFADLAQAGQMVSHTARFAPSMAPVARAGHLTAWKAALRRTRSNFGAEK